jgi:(p)ppGpp synthase/HD superfamily hydrolase
MFAIILMVMVIGEKVQEKLLANSKRLRIYILLEKKDGLYKFITFLNDRNISILEFEIIDNIGTFTSFSFVLKLTTKQKHNNILADIKSSNYVAYVDEA